MVAVLPSKNKFNFLRFDDFAVDIIVVARILQEKGERGFADQIKRSGTSLAPIFPRETIRKAELI